jgi:ATP-dependent DNA helicase HFM1/MER3
LITVFLIAVELAAAGIGAHHAGLELSDKRLVEELFMNKVLRVVVATSVGLSAFWRWVQLSLSPLDSCCWRESPSACPRKQAFDLPNTFPLAAHIVVIKDVRLFQNSVSQEYSDLDIMQMIGRAVS